MNTAKFLNCMMHNLTYHKELLPATRQRIKTSKKDRNIQTTILVSIPLQEIAQCMLTPGSLHPGDMPSIQFAFLELFHHLEELNISSG